MSFICQARPDYHWREKIGKLEPHQFEEWRRAARSVEKLLRPEGKDPLTQADFAADKGYHWNDDFLMDEDEVAVWTKYGVELTMSRLKGLASNSARLPDTIYQISVANVGLMQIQLVEVLEDCCTNEVQRYLDRGWRILAVCPPNDARRPTYVVGHFEREGHN